MLPNLFIAGAPKSGTTSLFQYLKGHPDVYMCPIKEPNYFSFEDIAQQELYYLEKGVTSIEDYKQLFQDVKSEKVVGEASVSYLFYKNVPDRIKKVIPDAKIIILLRNPIDRGFSHYLMDSRLGYINLSFENVVYKNSNHPLMDLYYQQFVGLGLYYAQIKRYIDVFGKNKIKIILNENMKDDLPEVIQSVCKFLNINNIPLDIDKKHNVYKKPRNLLVQKLYSSKPVRKLSQALLSKNLSEQIKDLLLIKGKKPILSQETRGYLSEIYKPDIQKLSQLIDIDLSSWSK